jgi:hypothetical protein
MSRTNFNILKSFVTEVLRESTQITDENLAAVIRHIGGKKQAYIYSISDLMSRIDKIEEIYSLGMGNGYLNNYFANNILKGFIEVGVPSGIYRMSNSTGKCNSAWMVYRSAGPGYGKVVYGAGYALSPSGRLIPDRGSVSDDAIGGWKKAFSSGRGRIPLDDIDHQHNVPGNEYHTDDPYDDCVVYDDESVNGNAEVLNQAYESEGWEKGMLDSMMTRHENCMKQLKNDFSWAVESWIKGSGGIFFTNNYLG